MGCQLPTNVSKHQHHRALQAAAVEIKAEATHRVNRENYMKDPAATCALRSLTSLSFRVSCASLCRNARFRDATSSWTERVNVACRKTGPNWESLKGRKERWVYARKRGDNIQEGAHSQLVIGNKY